MDKYEYRIKAEQIRKLAEQEDFASAMKIANTIDWNRVRSIPMLCLVGEIYEKNNMLEESRDVMLIAYDRHPYGRMIIYSLAELSIRLEDYIDAVEYYKEFVQVAPRDTGRYILQYKLYEAQHVGIQERIAVLEEFKRHEYIEKWAFELAYLYHRAEMKEKCVAECDELILWFADGKYVEKAMELKMIYAPLTEEQQKKYDSRNDVQIEKSIAAVEAVAEKPKEEEPEIEVKTHNYGIYDTVNLQKELARSMQQILDVTQQEPTEKAKDNFTTSEQSIQQQVIKKEIHQKEEEPEEAFDEEQVMAEAAKLLGKITGINQIRKAEEHPQTSDDMADEQKEDLDKTKVFEFNINEAPTKIIPVKEINAELQKQMVGQESIETIGSQHIQVPEKPETMENLEKAVVEDKSMAAKQERSYVTEVVSQTEMPEAEQVEHPTIMPDMTETDKEESTASSKEVFAQSEEEILEKQATSQMNIEEVLKEWERIKAAANEEEENSQNESLEETMFEAETEDEFDLITEEIELEVVDDDELVDDSYNEIEEFDDELEELSDMEREDEFDLITEEIELEVADDDELVDDSYNETEEFDDEQQSHMKESKKEIYDYGIDFVETEATNELEEEQDQPEEVEMDDQSEADDMESLLKESYDEPEEEDS
ncbi:MAG: hypothetical protein K2M46_05570, partial [Lachnospiraceae bacterium]|nr:hypothetical protein [Lachnospiraceae bacterium]